MSVETNPTTYPTQEPPVQHLSPTQPLFQAPAVVTKVKNPGRIQAGKKLAEFNRLKKINQQTKVQIKSETYKDSSPPAPPPTPEPIQLEDKQLSKPEPNNQSFTTRTITNNKIVVVSTGIAAAYVMYKVYKIKTEQSPKPTSPQSSPQSTPQSRSPPAILHQPTTSDQPTTLHVMRTKLEGKSVVISDPFVMQ